MRRVIGSGATPARFEALSLVDGPGGRDGAPAAPFTFLEEHDSGSQPCLSVRDARGRRWRIKWGHEARVEAFAVRLVWACGYFAEITHFVPAGVIEGAAALGRTRACVEAESGRFIDARFEADDPEVGSSSRSTAGRGTTTRSSARASCRA